MGKELTKGKIVTGSDESRSIRWWEFNSGLPQGSVLEAILLNIYINYPGTIRMNMVENTVITEQSWYRNWLTLSTEYRGVGCNSVGQDGDLLTRIYTIIWELITGK